MGTTMDVRPHTGFDGRYLGLTTFKRDGTGVTTPVWFVREEGRLLVATDPESYKVKRIRREPTVSVTLCTARGRLLEIPVAARAEILPDDEVPRVEALMSRKYRWDMLIFKPLRAIQRALHIGRYRGKTIILAITPT
jgi:PPOX class probable F420-dependent enzyme